MTEQLRGQTIGKGILRVLCAGSGIPSKYRGGGPAAVGGYKAELFGDTAKIGYEIYMDELAQCARQFPANNIPQHAFASLALGSQPAGGMLHQGQRHCNGGHATDAMRPRALTGR